MNVESFDPKAVDFLCLFFVDLRRSLVKDESEVQTKQCFFDRMPMEGHRFQIHDFCCLQNKPGHVFFEACQNWTENK